MTAVISTMRMTKTGNMGPCCTAGTVLSTFQTFNSFHSNNPMRLALLAP